MACFRAQNDIIIYNTLYVVFMQVHEVKLPLMYA